MATILLVDDVELFLELERSFLGGSGHRLVTLSSGEEVLERIERIGPDLLLLDLYMPGIDGDEVCRQLRARPRWAGLPVIMVTAAGKDKDVRKCLASGCDDYLTKPVSKKELLAKVWRLLEDKGGDDRPGSAADQPAAPPGEWLEENLRLRRRIEELEAENLEFANRMLRTEEINNNLTNLYIASSRLHSVLDPDKVLDIIREVVINFIGAEKFAILLRDKEGGSLGFETGEGIPAEGFPAVAVGEGILGGVAADRENYFVEGKVVDGSDDLLRPLAAIPLSIHGKALGVLAIYRLFTQKERFEAVDYQLFSMLAEHAATAIFSASLHAESERKRQTYRGLMDLLLK